MLETIKYLIGTAGPSGYGSKSTAEQVTESSSDLTSVTVIITGTTLGMGAETARVLAVHGLFFRLGACKPPRNQKLGFSWSFLIQKFI